MSHNSDGISVIQSGMLHTSLELLVQRIIQAVEKRQLADYKREFHNQLGMPQSHPDNTELIEDLWDFFYDWCVFEKLLLDTIRSVTPEEKNAWENLKKNSVRSLFSVSRVGDDALKLKDALARNPYVIQKSSEREFLGLSKGDLIECRLLAVEEEGKKIKTYQFVRKPSYHPGEIHPYLNTKIKQFRKSKNVDDFPKWLWVLVGMHLKHRFYPQMPVTKIYDDNSRI